MVEDGSQAPRSSRSHRRGRHAHVAPASGAALQVNGGSGRHQHETARHPGRCRPERRRTEADALRLSVSANCQRAHDSGRRLRRPAACKGTASFGTSQRRFVHVAFHTGTFPAAECNSTSHGMVGLLAFTAPRRESSEVIGPAWAHRCCRVGRAPLVQQPPLAQPLDYVPQPFIYGLRMSVPAFDVNSGSRRRRRLISPVRLRPPSHRQRFIRPWTGHSGSPSPTRFYRNRRRTLRRRRPQVYEGDSVSILEKRRRYAVGLVRSARRKWRRRVSPVRSPTASATRSTDSSVVSRRRCAASRR